MNSIYAGLHIELSDVRRKRCDMNEQIHLGMNALPLVRSADFCVTQRPFVHPNRTLNHHVLIYILQGSIQVVECGTEYVLQPGEMLLLKAQLNHWGTRPCPSGTAWIYAHFHLDELQGTAPPPDFVRNQEFEPDDFRHAWLLFKHRRFAVGDAIEANLHALVDQYHSANPLRAGCMNALLLQILLDAHQCDRDAKPESSASRTLGIIRHLEEHMNQPFDSTKLVQAMGLSYKYLNEQFRRETNMTALQYHTSLRMAEAARLLRETPLSITEISERLGYANVFYFSNVFKKIHGVSPSRY